MLYHEGHEGHEDATENDFVCFVFFVVKLSVISSNPQRATRNLTDHGFVPDRPDRRQRPSFANAENL